MNKVGISTGFSLRGTPGSVVTPKLCWYKPCPCTTDLQNSPRENTEPRASAGGWRRGCRCVGDPNQQDAEGRALMRALRSDLGSALKKDTEGAQNRAMGRT